MSDESPDPPRPRPRFSEAVREDRDTEPSPSARLDGIARTRGVTPTEKRLIRRPDPEEADQLKAYRLLADVSRKLSSILDQDALLDAILDAVIPLARAERGIILMLQDGEMSSVRGRDRRGEVLNDDAVRVSKTLAQQCLEENRIRHFSDLNNAPELREVKSIRALDILSAICIPLHDKGRPFGVLYLDSHLPTLPLRSQSELLEAFAAQASVSLSNARLLEQLEESKSILVRENEDLRAEVRGRRGFENLVGESPAMQRVFERIRLVKDLDVPVLVLGESGTGKELVARAIQSEGARSEEPFVPINCGAVPSELLESELFGHEKGAFTGATRAHPGMVEQANGGTLFLDEVGDMPLPFQLKLLRFLESGEFRRVGDAEQRHADVRVISATNRALGEMLGGTFREDLFYRLDGVRIELPPLRERREDIPLLVSYYLEKIQERHPREIRGITERAQRFLNSYPWPGNVRQLVHALRGACALVPDGRALDESHLTSHLADLNGQPTNGKSILSDSRNLQEIVAEAERTGIERALQDHDWNITRAAKDLGISRQHLHNRIRVHDLERPK